MVRNIFEPKYDIYTGKRIKKRKAFKTSTKKREWNKAAGRSEDDFKSTSKCRYCKRRLTWGSRTYDFDHKDNNPSNNSQKNCYLLCKVCHGKHTVLAKRKKYTITGVKYETIKKKVGYKKSTRRKSTKKKKTGKRKPTSILDYKLPEVKFKF